MTLSKQTSLPRGTIVPNHIAVILDGNGRWARSRGLLVTKGHEAGTEALKKILETCRGLGVHTLTIWGFSTENWSRPPKEVAKIMELLTKTLKEVIRNAQKEGVRFAHLGRKDRLPTELVKLLKKAEEETKANKKYILNLALDYGGRDEILRAIKKIVEDRVPSSKIDEKLFSEHLDTKGQPYPNPDLLIRTSGEQRTSGLLPWQMVYGEFYFEECHLPDMTPEKLKAILLDYSRRRRRFGAKDKVAHFRFKPEVSAKLELAWWRLSKIPENKTFLQYTIEHIKEQWGVSTQLATRAALLMTQALVHGKKSKWEKATLTLKKFYKLIRDEVKLAFEPSIVASAQIAIWQKTNNGHEPEVTGDFEETTRQFLSELYRISDLQAKKAAHLRSLATLEWSLAERGEGEEHWKRAEDYLHKYYKALKERVA